MIALTYLDALDDSITNTSFKQPKLELRTKLVDPNRIMIWISDNGSGMPPEIQERIFDPFFTTKDVGEGTGMGLAISYQVIVEKHGGQLECISVLGKGTEFVIVLPIKPDRDTISMGDRCCSNLWPLLHKRLKGRC